MIQIFHNPRCQKSRDALKLIERSEEEIQVIHYLKDIPTKDELGKLIDCLGITPEKLVRKNEALWKENYRDRSLSGEEILNLMVKNPKLIERPILVKDNYAVLGRSEDKVREFMKILGLEKNI